MLLTLISFVDIVNIVFRADHGVLDCADYGVLEESERV